MASVSPPAADGLFDVPVDEARDAPQADLPEDIPHDTRFDDFDDLPGDTEDKPKAEEKPKKVNRARLEFDTFVGVKVSEAVGVEEGVEGIQTTRVEDPYDHFWESLFLKRVALFPSLEDATILAEQRAAQPALLYPAGTTPWFEGFRPESVAPEVFHLERLLLRVREWSQEVRHIKHDLMSFAEKIQNKTANVKSVDQFANHRFHMVKKFLNEDWMEQALDIVQKDVNEKENRKRAFQDNRMNESLEVLRTIGRGQEQMLDANPEVRVQSSQRDSSFAASLKQRQEMIKNKRREKERADAAAARKAKMLEKRRQKQAAAETADYAAPPEDTDI